MREGGWQVEVEVGRWRRVGGPSLHSRPPSQPPHSASFLSPAPS